MKPLTKAIFPVAGLGTRFFVSESAIKVFSVGYPIQAPLDALLTLRRQHDLTPANVERILVRLPADGAGGAVRLICGHPATERVCQPRRHPDPASRTRISTRSSATRDLVPYGVSRCARDDGKHRVGT